MLCVSSFGAGLWGLVPMGWGGACYATSIGRGVCFRTFLLKYLSDNYILLECYCHTHTNDPQHEFDQFYDP